MLVIYVVKDVNIPLLQYLFALTKGNSLKARLLRGGVGSVAVKGLNLVLVLVLSVILARVLGAEKYGEYAYAIAIMSLLMVGAEAGVPVLLMREIASAQANEKWGFMRGAIKRALQFVTLSATSVTLSGLFVLWLVSDRLSDRVLYTTLIMLLALPLLTLAKITAHAIYGLQRVVIGQSLDMLLRPILVLLLVSIAFLAWPGSREPQYVMVAQLAVSLVVLVVSMILLRRLLPSKIKQYPIEFKNREWLKSALPFTLLGGAGIINNQIDIIMLGWFRDSNEVGIFRVATQGAVLVAFGLQAVNAVLAPQFARFYAQGDMVKLQRLVTVSARIILLSALPVALALIAAGGAIVSWIFGADFNPAYLPLAILSIGQLANAAFGSVGFLLNMTGHEKITARVLWQTAGLNVLLNAMFIPYWGMAGAAVATAISLAVWNYMLFLAVLRLLKLNSTAFSIQT
jgi:O-antigen/teichoic acid export membrane protein